MSLTSTMLLQQMEHCSICCKSAFNDEVGLVMPNFLPLVEQFDRLLLNKDDLGSAEFEGQGVFVDLLVSGAIPLAQIGRS